MIKIKYSRDHLIIFTSFMQINKKTALLKTEQQEYKHQSHFLYIIKSPLSIKQQNPVRVNGIFLLSFIYSGYSSLFLLALWRGEDSARLCPAFQTRP